MEEIWKDVVGYEGYYQVSNLGRVKSLDRYVQRGQGTRLVHGRILNQAVNTNGYLRVILSRGNKTKNTLVHRLVAEAFIPNPEHAAVVDHIDNNRQNNSVSNLRWCTQSENIEKSYRQGRRTSVFNLDAIQQKRIASVSKPVIRSDGMSYKSVSEAASDLGVTWSAISHVLYGRAKTCRGYSFAFIDKN